MKPLLLFLLIGLLTTLPGQARPDNRILQHFCELSNQADYPGEIEYANRILSHPQAGHTPSIRLLCLSKASQAYSKTDSPVNARTCLEQATGLLTEIPEQKRDSTYYEAYYAYCNARTVYSVYYTQDYKEALQYTTAALKLAQSRADTYQSILFGLNYIILCTHTQKDFSYQGAEELYQQALETGNAHLILNAAKVCALKNEAAQDYLQARQYTRQAINWLPEGHKDTAEIYAQYAKYLLYTDEQQQSEIYFQKALDHARGKIPSSSNLSVYLTYAECMENYGNLDKAASLYRRGIQMADSAHTSWNRHNFYLGLYRTLHKQGRYQEAINWLLRYTETADSIRNERMKRDITELKIKYETAVKEKTIEENEKMIARQEQKITLFVSVLILIGVITLLTTILYLNKRMSYLTLLKLHQQMLNRQKEEQHDCPETPANPQTAFENTACSESDQTGKYQELFDRIECQMKNGHLYREAGLTLDKAAKEIGSNRTYLSAAIKQYTGLSFNYYLNSYRIREAIDLLGDADNQTPLKAIIAHVGFKSPTTFFKLFQEVTGTTPQVYREQARNNA